MIAVYFYFSVNIKRTIEEIITVLKLDQKAAQMKQENKKQLHCCDKM